MKKVITIFLSCLICVWMVCVCGCGKSGSDWDIEADSLMNFPWGCSIEQAEKLLNVQDAKRDDSAVPARTIGRGREVYFYTLPEGYPMDVDTLVLTTEYYREDGDKDTEFGVTELRFTYKDREMTEEGIESVEMTAEQKAYIRKLYTEQIERCKGLYMAQAIRNEQLVEVSSCGEWSKPKAEKLLFLNKTFPEYDFDTYQNQYPLVTASYTDSSLIISGQLLAYTN